MWAQEVCSWCIQMRAETASARVHERHFDLNWVVFARGGQLFNFSVAEVPHTALLNLLHKLEVFHLSIKICAFAKRAILASEWCSTVISRCSATFRTLYLLRSFAAVFSTQVNRLQSTIVNN
jgi:hypothetical protein